MKTKKLHETRQLFRLSLVEAANGAEDEERVVTQEDKSTPKKATPYDHIFYLTNIKYGGQSTKEWIAQLRANGVTSGKPIPSPYVNLVGVEVAPKDAKKAYKIFFEHRANVVEAADTFAVMAIDPQSDAYRPRWDREGPSPKVVWQMWDLAKGEVVIAAKMAREKHPKATISVENKAGKIVRVWKPGVPITEAATGVSEGMPGTYLSLTNGQKQVFETLRDMRVEDRLTIASSIVATLARKPEFRKSQSTLQKIADQLDRLVDTAITEAVANPNNEPFIAAYVSKDHSVSCVITRAGRTMSSPVRMTFKNDKTKTVLGDILYVGKKAAEKDWMQVHTGGIKYAQRLLATNAAFPTNEEAEGVTKTPSEVDRLKTAQETEKIQLQQRQANQLMAAKLRDVQKKSREQMNKATAPKSAAKSA